MKQLLLLIESSPKTPKRGFEFLHKKWRDPDTKKPMKYVVTKVANGVVYYKPVGWNRGIEKIAIEDFYNKVVKEGLQPFSASGVMEAVDGKIFTWDTIKDDAKKIERNIHAPEVGVQVSALGGKDRASIMLTLSLDEKRNWKNGILQNSRYMHFSIGGNGVVEQFGLGHGVGKKFRKVRVTSIKDVIRKINDYLKPFETAGEKASYVQM